MATDEWVRWYWYFKNSGVDIFKIVESAIGVAARSRTKEFMKRRVKIAELLFAIKKGDVFSEAEQEDLESLSSAKINLKYGCHDLNGDQTGKTDEFFTKEEKEIDQRKGPLVHIEEEVIKKSHTKSPDEGVGKIRQGDHEIKPRHIIRLKLRPNRKKEKEQSLLVLEETDKIAVARSQLENSPQTIPPCSKDHQKKLLPTEEVQLLPKFQQVPVPNMCSAPMFPKKTISKGGGQCNSKKEEKKFHVIDQVQQKRDEDKQLVVALESSKKLCGKEEKILFRAVDLEAAKTNAGRDQHEDNLCSAAATSQKKIIQNKISVGSKHDKFPVTGVKKLGAEIQSSKKTFCPRPQEAAKVIKDTKKPPSLNEAAFERKLEASKRKLEQGYKQFENAKKRTRMIDLKDLPQRRAVVGCRPVQTYRGSRKPVGHIPHGLIT